MPSTSIAAGALLLLVGIAGYVYGMTQNSASVTALIPAFIGILLLVFGFLAKSKESLRKHLMHAAVLVALLGFIAILGDLARTGFNFTMSAALISKLLTGLICLFFVILSIQSFINARRNQ